MKLSKQFMQTNLKWAICIGSPFHLTTHNKEQMAQASAGIARKENRQGVGMQAALGTQTCTITGLFVFVSLIPLLFYVLVKPTRHFMAQVCSKTQRQPSWDSESPVFLPAGSRTSL